MALNARCDPPGARAPERRVGGVQTGLLVGPGSLNGQVVDQLAAWVRSP